MFSLVLDSITTSWKSAVSSASVGGEVRVGWSSVTFLIAFNDTITTFGGDFEEVDWSAVSGLEASVVVGQNASELGQLASGNWDWVGEDEPVSVFRAASRGQRTLVVEGSWGGWQQSSWVDGDVEGHGLSANVGLASWAASVDGGQRVSASLIAKLTIQMINNSITAFGKSAVGSAEVGSSNVLSGIIAFLSRVGNTITASWQSAVGSAASWFGVVVAGSIVANFSGINTSVSALLLARARASITIEVVSVVASFSTSHVNNSVTAFGNAAPGSASIGFVGIVLAIIAFFQGIEDAITASPEEAVGSASVGNSVAVVDSVVAFFSGFQDSVSADDSAVLALSGVGSSITVLTIVSDTITASGQSAVGSAGVGDGVGVGSSVIALFAGGVVESSVSAEEGAGNGAGGVSVQDSVIASLTVIFDTITANWESAVGSASVGDGGREVSAVALFTNVQNTITASWQFAVGSAARGLFVGVVNTQVTLFVLTLDTITAFDLAVGVAAVSVDVVSVVASFTHQVISNAITAVWEDASRSASVGQEGVEDSSVALFLAGINDTVTAVCQSAVGSASVGQLVVVVGSIIALFSDPGSIRESLDVFLDSVSASALGDWWESVKDGLENSVGAASFGEENGQNGIGLRSWVLRFVEQLDFEGESSVSNDVLGGLVELNVTQGVGNSSVAEGSSVQSGEQNVVSSVEQNNGGWVVLDVGWVVEVEGSGSWAGFWESDG